VNIYAYLISIYFYMDISIYVDMDIFTYAIWRSRFKTQSDTYRYTHIYTYVYMRLRNIRREI